MDRIPGLNLCTTGDDTGNIHTLTSFSGTFNVPESIINGRCRRYNSFEKQINLTDGPIPTYKCRDRESNALVTLRRCKKPKDPQKALYDTLLETKILAKLTDVHFVKHIEIGVGNTIDNTFVIFEYCDYIMPELFADKMGPIFDTNVVKNIMQQLFVGLDYMHKLLIVHRNLEPKNIFFNKEGVLKIGNFENAQELSSRYDPTLDVDFSWYQSPELILQTKTPGTYFDMWSAGCVFAELLLRKPLFPGESAIDVLRRIYDVLGMPNETIWPGYSELPGLEKYKMVEAHSYNLLSFFVKNSSKNAIDLLRCLLVYDPQVRITAEMCLKHPYFQENPKAAPIESLPKVLNYSKLYAFKGGSALERPVV